MKNLIKITIVIFLLIPVTSIAYTKEACIKRFKQGLKKDTKRFCKCKMEVDKGVNGDIKKRLEVAVKCIARKGKNNGKN